MPSSILAEAPFQFGRDLINAMLLHSNGDPIGGIYILTKLVREVGDMMQVWNDDFDTLIAGGGTWPGGRTLEPMSTSERTRRIASLRAGWPKRADQVRAEQQPKTKKRNRRRKDA